MILSSSFEGLRRLFVLAYFIAVPVGNNPADDTAGIKNTGLRFLPTQQTFVGLEDVFKTSSRHVLKTSPTRLQRNNFTSSKTSSRRLRKQSIDSKWVILNN